VDRRALWHNNLVSHLVVIFGPIASGKTTLAVAIGGRLRDEGREVSVLDLDEAVEASGSWTGLTAERFRKAQIAFGRHVGAWLDQGVDVIAHGPLFEPGALEAVLDNIPRAAQISYVRLITTYEVALKRATADPNRQLSRDPDFLRMTYDRIGPLLDALPTARWTFDTTSTPSVDIVEELSAALLSQGLLRVSQKTECDG
jgi:energy-coupling factor transporter ATP-binding protein EcfA2